MLVLPSTVPIVFVGATIFSLAALFHILHGVVSRKDVLIITIPLLAWMTIQAILSFGHFYLAPESVPPRFLFAVLPPLLVTILVFLLPARKVVWQLPLQALTLLHIVRIPVELVLWWLYNEGYVPKLMTFEGGNLDIISGITAALVGVWAFWGRLKPRLLLIWNIFALLSVINIVVRAVLTLPYSTQQLAFEQPNQAVLYFPFIWLPSVIVPIVLFCHAASIGQLASADTLNPPKITPRV